MEVILSNKAAKRLQIERQVVNQFTPDINTWRIDSESLLKRSIFIITNEITLYTLVSSYKNGFNGIIKKLTGFCEDNQLNSKEINYIKFENRRVIGSMNDIKQMIKKIDKYDPKYDNELYEQLVNQTPFKYLSYSCPSNKMFDNFSQA